MSDSGRDYEDLQPRLARSAGSLIAHTPVNGGTEFTPQSAALMEAVMAHHDIKISCWRRDCASLATPVSEGKKKKGVNREVCFRCEKGHQFHTDATMTRSSPCDCRSEKRNHHLVGWAPCVCPVSGR